MGLSKLLLWLPRPSRSLPCRTRNVLQLQNGRALIKCLLSNFDMAQIFVKNSAFSRYWIFSPWNCPLCTPKRTPMMTFLAITYFLLQLSFFSYSFFFKWNVVEIDSWEVVWKYLNKKHWNHPAIFCSFTSRKHQIASFSFQTK